MAFRTEDIEVMSTGGQRPSDLEALEVPRRPM